MNDPDASGGLYFCCEHTETQGSRIVSGQISLSGANRRSCAQPSAIDWPQNGVINRLLGLDNAHGVPRAETYDHRHRFRRTKEIVAYEFRGADELICDFFAAVEQACKQEGVPFEFEADEVDLVAEEEDDDGAQITG